MKTPLASAAATVGAAALLAASACIAATSSGSRRPFLLASNRASWAAVGAGACCAYRAAVGSSVKTETISRRVRNWVRDGLGIMGEQGKLLEQNAGRHMRCGAGRTRISEYRAAILGWVGVRHR